MEMRFVVYVNPACPHISIVSGDRIKQWAPFARIHTTMCGEWTQGTNECSGGHWLGPFSYEEAVHAANATGLPVVRCNLLLKFLKGEVRDKKPGYKAQDLHLFAVEEFRLRTILRYPSEIEVILEIPVIIEGQAYHLGDYLNLSSARASANQSGFLRWLRAHELTENRRMGRKASSLAQGHPCLAFGALKLVWFSVRANKDKREVASRKSIGCWAMRSV